MLEKVKRWIDEYRLIASGDRVLAACSGGPDSMALVHILHRLRSEYWFSLAVAHVDHMFRGQESAQEAVFVQEFSVSLGLDCYKAAIDVPGFIAESGRSPQDAARKLRYEYLRQVANELGGAKIATGHHSDDQAETVLLNLLRGAGSLGLRGMQPEGEGIIRPLLAISRAEIEAYCAEHKLTPVMDSSNYKTDYLRNRVRLELMPILEEYNSNIKQLLGRTAEIIGDEHDFIRQQAERYWPQVAQEEEARVFIAFHNFKLLHIAVQREICRISIEKIHGRLTGITFYHVEKMVELILIGMVGNILQLPGGVVVRKCYEGVELLPPDTALPSGVCCPDTVLEVPGTTFIPALGTTVTAEIIDPDDRLPSATAFDWQAITPPLVLRTRRTGDRFNPCGMDGSKKLKDFFIDEKVPREKRDQIPIICDKQGIILVGGYRQAERGKVNNNTKKILQLIINK